MTESLASQPTSALGGEKPQGGEGPPGSSKFRVLRLIGEGGMGAVYVATHVLTKRTGALKLLSPRYASVPAVHARFVREASAAALIDNPHIVQTYDAGSLDTGQPYMFMELLEGAPLDEWLKERAPSEVSESLQIAAQACDGLAAAHRAGVVHRDIKPGNLFVLDEAPPFVKVLDFGISKFSSEFNEFEPQLTQEGAVLGTPLYMSPEQVMGQRDIDARTDIYSLGVVLYEMLTGRTPFSGQTLMQLGTRICSGEFEPVQRSRDDIPHALEEVLRRALSKNKEARYASCEEFGDALRSCQAELPPAQVESAPPRAQGEPAQPSTKPSTLEDAAVATLLPSADSFDSAHPPAPPTHLPPGAQVGTGGAAGGGEKSRGGWLALTLLLVSMLIWGVYRWGTQPQPPASNKLQAQATSDVAAPPAAGGYRSTSPQISQPSAPESSAGEQKSLAVVEPVKTAAKVRVRQKEEPAQEVVPSPTPSASSLPAARDGLLLDNPFREPPNP